jgi:two-component system sensor histidine kinase PilS (NtrC family)
MVLARLYDKNTVRKIENFSFLRLCLLGCVVVTTIFLKQDVLGLDAMTQIYLALGITFLISLLHAAFWEETLKVSYFITSQLIYDLLLISYLIYLTGINESIFLFLYLLNIVLASVVYQMYGALFIALLSGTVYGLIFYVNRDTNNVTEVYSLLYNELFFLLTALLCGQLMDELKKQKTLLDDQMQNIVRLEQLNEQLLNSIPVGVVLVDENDYIKTINSAATSTLQLNPSADILYKFYDLIPPLKEIRAKWDSLAESERLRFHFSLPRGPEQTQVFSFQMITLKEPPQLKDNLIFMFQDITNILELESRLEMDTRLAAVGQLAAGIAHEIRNPLASISGSLEILRENLKVDNDEDRKLMSIALRETQRLNHLITDFLQYARPKPPKFQSLKIGAVVLEVVEAIQTRLGDMSKVHFKINIPDDLVIFGDEERIKQVFFNLFINSIEASTGQDLLIKVDAGLKRNFIQINVADNGLGIAADISKKIFDPFFTTKSAGTGLGLSMVSQIIKSHNATIQVVSGKGAQFRLRFPAQQAALDHSGVA